jgi:hypothetical protein
MTALGRRHQASRARRRQTLRQGKTNIGSSGTSLP